MKDKLVKILSKIGSLMNEEFVNKVFKIGIIFIGIGFLVVYFFHSQNGRFHKFGDDTDNFLNYQILDTRTGIVYHSLSIKNTPLTLFSVNITNGKVKFYTPEIKDEQKTIEDFLKGKK